MSHQILPWGITLKPGGPTKVPVMASEASFEVLHVTACALGEKPDEGPHVVKVIVEDADQNEVPIVMGTLCAKSRIFQFPADMGLSEDTTFINTGKTPVFLSGYKTISMYEVTDDMDSDEEGGFYSDEEEESDGEPPLAVPIGKTNGRLAAAQARPHTAAAAAAAASSDEDEDEEEDEDEDEEEDEEEDSDASLPRELDSDDVVGVVEEDVRGARGMMDMDADDEDEDEEEDEDEDELEDEEEEEEDSEDEPAPPSKAAAAAAKPFKGTPQLQQRQQQQQQQPSKRPLEAATPQPAKKQKPAAAAVPSSAPAKVQGGGGQQAGGADAAYHQKLLSVLKAESAPITVANLGNKLGAKPSKDFRLGRYISEHPELFVYNAATQTVVLKKK